MRSFKFSIGIVCLIFSLNCHRLAPLEPQNLSSLAPKNLFPANDTTDIPINVNFVWSGSNSGKNDSVSYDFYLSAAQPEPDLITSGITDTCFYFNSLNYNTKYYWKVVARDQNGKSKASPVWSFVTRYEHNNPPNMPGNPQPKNGATSLLIGNSTLHWSGGDPDSFSVVSYDVYVGAQTINSLQLVSESQPDTFFLLNNLEFDTQYYWKIIAKDNYGLRSQGPVWKFSTAKVQLIFEDNFDSYPTNGSPETKIWTINESNANLFITDAISWQNIGKSVCFIDSTEEGSCFLGTRLPTRAAGKVAFDWRITSGQDVFGLRMYSQRSEKKRLGPQLSIRQGKLQYYDSNFYWQTVCEIDSNTWYQVQLVFNCPQKYYEIYINQKLMVKNATWTGTSVPDLDIIYFLTFDNRKCLGAYLDEFRFYAGTGI